MAEIHSLEPITRVVRIVRPATDESVPTCEEIARVVQYLHDHRVELIGDGCVILEDERDLLRFIADPIAYRSEVDRIAAERRV